MKSTQYTDRLTAIRNARTHQSRTAQLLRNEALIRFISAPKTAPSKADHRAIFTLALLVTAIVWVVLK